MLYGESNTLAVVGDPVPRFGDHDPAAQPYVVEEMAERWISPLVDDTEAIILTHLHGLGEVMDEVGEEAAALRFCVSPELTRRHTLVLLGKHIGMDERKVAGDSQLIQPIEVARCGRSEDL